MLAVACYGADFVRAHLCAVVYTVACATAKMALRVVLLHTDQGCSSSSTIAFLFFSSLLLVLSSCAASHYIYLTQPVAAELCGL
jgi:Ni/Fe-hydrogenase subunit HybB-like protein